METIITIILLAAGSAIANWVKARGQKDQEQDWDQLEDWVGRNVPPKEREPDLPPVERRETRPIPPLAAPRAPAPPRPLFRIPEEQPDRPRPIIPPFVHERLEELRRRASPPPYPTSIPEPEESEPRESEILAKLREVREGSARASQLYENVAAQFRAMDSSKAGRRDRKAQSHYSTEANVVVRMLKDPVSVRRAILASMILAPCKALENDPSQAR